MRTSLAGIGLFVVACIFIPCVGEAYSSRHNSQVGQLKVIESAIKDYQLDHDAPPFLPGDPLWSSGNTLFWEEYMCGRSPTDIYGTPLVYDERGLRSIGPNKIDENGKGDDITATSKLLPCRSCIGHSGDVLIYMFFIGSLFVVGGLVVVRLALAGAVRLWLSRRGYTWVSPKIAFAYFAKKGLTALPPRADVEMLPIYREDVDSLLEIARLYHEAKRGG